MVVRVTFHSISNSEMFWKLLWFFVNFSFRTRSCSFVSLRNTIMEQFFIVLSWNFVNICTFISKNERIFWWTYVLQSFWSLFKNSFLTVLNSIDCFQKYLNVRFAVVFQETWNQRDYVVRFQGPLFPCRNRKLSISIFSQNFQPFQSYISSNLT